MFLEYLGPENKLTSLIFHKTAAEVVPPNTPIGAQPVDFALVDSQEKFEALLLNEPEPSPDQLEAFLKSIEKVLPKLRKLAIAKAKQLPHARGGAPRKLGSIEDQRKIIEEIKRLRGPGVKLADIFVRLAQKFGVSPSKIKQIWSKSPR